MPVADLDALDRAALIAALPATAARRLAAVEIHASLDSTNGYLLAAVGARAPLPTDTGLACLAEQQRAGRGRRGRPWASPFGASLYLSLAWRLALAPHQLSGLSLCLGVAAVSVLEQQYSTRGLGLKWPNDILWRGRKLGGILLELSHPASATAVSDIVIGIGLNIAMPPATPIDQPWVNLTEVLSCGPSAVSRNALAAALLAGFIDALDRFSRSAQLGPGCGIDAFADGWRRLDLSYGRALSVIQGARVIQGYGRGVDSAGALLLETLDGLRRFDSGEVSLRLKP